MFTSRLSPPASLSCCVSFLFFFISALVLPHLLPSPPLCASSPCSSKKKGGGGGGSGEMFLGKTRSMRRTTSLTDFAADVILAYVEDSQQPPQEQEKIDRFLRHQPDLPPEGRASGAAEDWLEAGYQGSLMPPSPLVGRQRRSSADLAVAETAHFLRACGLCKRRLGPGRDTFMYRGDIAFCSLECRQQHINGEERRENCSLTSIKDISPANNAPEQSGDAEMITAA